MKRNVAIKFSMATLLCLISFQGRAQDSAGGLFVEPSVTYELGSTKVNYPSPISDSSGSADGFGLGARLGYHYNSAFFFGLDGRFSMPQFKDDSVGYDERATAMNWGPVVGIQMPDIGLRVWGTYIVGGEFNPDNSASLDVRFKKACGFRIGTGFKVSMVSLNLEYQQLKYDQTILEQVGPFRSSGSFGGVKLDNNSWIASVSFPLAL